MTIEKAIELLERYISGEYIIASNVPQESIKLGIEAMKGIKYLRVDDIIPKDELLPGETEED